MFNIADFSIVKLQNTDIPYERVFVTDPGKRGLYEYDPLDNTSLHDGRSIIVTKNLRRYKLIFGEKLEVAPGLVASYSTKGEDLIRVTNTTVKSIIVSTVDVEYTYLFKRKTLTIVDEAFDAFNTPITIAPQVGLINQQPSIQIQVSGGSVQLYSNGTDLFTLNWF